MRLMQMKSENNRWGFTGASIPMELARKTWSDKYAAVRAADKAGFVVMANGSCVSDTEPAARVKSEDGLGSRRTPECMQEDHLTTREEEGA